MSEFEFQNPEAFFGIVHQNRDCHPGGERMVLMNYAQARQLEERAQRAEKAVDTNFVQLQPDDEFTARQKVVARVGGSVCRAIPAAVLLIGAGEGLVNLYFSGVCAVPFLFWAVAHWLNK